VHQTVILDFFVAKKTQSYIYATANRNSIS